MATIVSEFRGFETTSGRSPSAVATWGVTGTTDEPTVRALVLSEAPTNYEGLLRDDLKVKEQGGGVWICTLAYRLGDMISENDPTLGGTGSPDSNDSHEPAGASGGSENPIPAEFSMEIGGKSLKVTQSLNTRVSAKRLDDVNEIPNYKRAVGVSRGPSGILVEGAEVDITETSWTETWVFLRARCTYAYMWMLEEFANCVNHESWRGCEEEEVRFMGASVQSHGVDQVRITYRFKKSKNIEFDADPNPESDPAENPVAPGFDAITKRGHEYLWFTYRQTTDENKLGAEPEHAYVEQMYYRANFERLGIGK